VQQQQQHHKQHPIYNATFDPLLHNSSISVVVCHCEHDSLFARVSISMKPLANTTAKESHSHIKMHLQFTAVSVVVANSHPK
jgi:hypothetical protein